MPWWGRATLGMTVEGPTGENSSLIASVRRSYLQLLFEVLGLPFLPIYNDYQYKWVWRPDDRNAVTVLGLGALDDFELNLDLASDTEAPDYLNQVAILDVLPISEQWNYMQGVKWDRYMEDGKWTFVLSRNMLNNSAFKHVDNDVDLASNFGLREPRNREQIPGGALPQFAERMEGQRRGECGIREVQQQHPTSVFVPEVGSVDVTFGSDFKMAKYGAFAQASRPLLDNRLTLSAGLRMDGALLLDATEGLTLPEASPLANPLDQFSPRLSASWSFAPGWTWNANAGIYHQLPAYTILGYAGLGADSTSTLLNWSEGLTYTTNRQLVMGIRKEIASRNAAVSVEGFYKGYDGSPASANTGIALANLGADFGVVGNETVTFDAEGRAYGMEVLLQQRLYKGYYGLLAYTLVRSEYQNPGEDFALQSWVPSSWDNRHIVSFTGGKKWDSGWEVGARVLFSGGLPYTPYALDQSLLIENWETFNAAIPDYAALNTDRNGAFHQVDLRIDRKWFFDNWSLDVFADLQNITAAAPPQPDQLDVVRDPATGRPIPSTTNPGFYDPRFISTATGAVLPGLGMIVEL